MAFSLTRNLTKPASIMNVYKVSVVMIFDKILLTGFILRIEKV
jgi:hypothetical protein